jgi:hypothetical protein
MATSHQVTVFFNPSLPFSKEDKAKYKKLKLCAECTDDYIFFDLDSATDTAVKKFVADFKELSGLDNPTIRYNIYMEAPEYTWDLIDSDDFNEAFANHFGNGYDIVCGDEFFVSGDTREEAKDKLKQVKAFVKEYIKNQKRNRLLTRLEQYA